MDLTTKQWLAIDRIIPPAHAGRGRPPVDMRSLLNGIIWKISSTSPWRELPSRYPSHQSCYRYYCEWKSSHVFRSIMESLYADLLYRGNFTPYQAVEKRQIILHIAYRKFLFYIAPTFQNDWRANTALLLLQFELPNAIETFIEYYELNPRQKLKDAQLLFSFSKWPRFAPLGYESYSGPEDVAIPITR